MIDTHRGYGSLFGGQQNVLFDVSKYGQGQSDQLALERNRLMLDVGRRDLANDEAFRAAAPAALSGDPAAMATAAGANPQGAMEIGTYRMRVGQNEVTLNREQRARAAENATLIGQGLASLLAVPDDQAASLYPQTIQQLRSRGVDVSSIPQQYPGRAVIEQGARATQSVAEQLRAHDERIVLAGDTSQPRGIRNNNPLNIEAGSFTQGMPGFKGSDGRFAVFESPDQGMAAADALLMRYGTQGLNTPAKIIAKWAPAGDGNNNPGAYAGTVARALGVGPNDPIPMEDPAMRRRLAEAMAAVENGQRAAAPLVRQGTGLPVTAGAQPGMQWVRQADGAMGQAPIPGAGERARPPDGFRQTADGGMEPIPGGPSDPRYKGQVAQASADARSQGHPIPAGDRTKLVDAGSRLSELDRLATTFDDRYGGFGSALVGDAVNTIGRNTPGESPRGDWWQGYQALKNVVRNDQFGAALTKTEKAEFEKSDINPGMSPATIRSNLARQSEIVRTALERRARSLAADGYRVDALQEATGIDISRPRGAAAPSGGGAEMTATNPQTGEKIVLRNGKWEPMK